MSRLAAFAALAALAATAHAQKAPAHAPDPVKVHLDQGAALYNDGNYSAALAEFEAAYALDPRPYILNNIGLAQKGLFRYQEAIATLQKYLLDSTAITNEQRKQTQQIIAEMQALLSPLTLDVHPAGAQVSLDGHALGAAPITTPLEVAAGSHVVDVALDGYTSVHREVMVGASTPLAISIALNPVHKVGMLHVTTVPQGTIVVDGRSVGLGDFRAQLDAGGHTLDVSAPGFLNHHEELVLGADQERSLAVHLDAKAKWYSHWYIWVPVSIVVVGVATAITVDQTTHQGPLQGSLGLGKAQ
jgi:tetratricopeptide (TPR) repeat protein